MKRFVSRLCLFFAVIVFSISALAVTPSPAMLEQLKKLPKSEQQRIARQYGFDLDKLNQSPSADAVDTSEKDSQVQLEPLKTPEQLEEIKKKELNEQDKKPIRFGMNMFDPTISTFAPIGNVPVPDSYSLGADDELLIQLFGKQSAEEKVKVARDGTLSIPGFSPFNVAGLSFVKAKELIAARIKEQNLGVEVAVSMGKLRTINVMIVGEAKFPGSYTVSALSTLTQALFVSGGVSDIGSLREIKVKRAGVEVANFDLYKLLMHGDASRDVFLKHGDVVFISPIKSAVEISGEVQRPAIYEVLADETVADVVKMAGGSKAGAFPRKVVVERFNDENIRELLNVDLTKAAEGKALARNGDVIRIGQTSKRVKHMVTVAGAVVRPGQFAWAPGIRVNDLLTSLWSDLHLTVDLEFALVVRENSAAGQLSVLQFNLGKAINSPESSDNLELRARDLVLVFHHGDLSFQRSELDKFLYTKLLDQYPEEKLFAKTEPLLDDKQPKPFVVDVSAITTQAFAALTEKNDVEETRPGVKPEEPKLPQNFQHKAYLKAQITEFLNNVYSDPELLKLSGHLTRTELLYPLLEKLRQQARFNAASKIVSVDGEVKLPGEYPLTENAGVAGLLIAAGGLTDNAYLERAELTRSVSQSENQSGMTIQHHAVNLVDVLQGTTAMPLKSRDRLMVFAVPDWGTEKSVTLTGQVKFPGKYSIQRGEKLSQVLARAGGLTKDAFPQGTVFTRKQIREQESMQLSKLMQQLRSDIAAKNLSAESDGMQTKPEDAIMMIAEIEKAKPIGRLVIDVDQVLRANPDFDLLVEEGDELYVPYHQTTVAVVGEVQHASSHRFKNGMTVDDYLQLAGGFRKRADDERVYVIRADGSVFVPNQSSWFAVSDNALQAGDTIVVPLDTDYTTRLSLWSKVTTIISQSIVALAAINNTTN